MPPNDPSTLPTLWYAAHEAWAHADEAATMAEEKVKLVEAELFNHADETSAEAKKQWVRRDERYRAAAFEAIRRRTEANLKLGERKKIEMACDIWRTLESTKRAEMQLK